MSVNQTNKTSISLGQTCTLYRADHRTRWSHAPSGLLISDWPSRRGGTLAGNGYPGRVWLQGRDSAVSAMAARAPALASSLLAALLVPALVALLVSPAWGRGGRDHGDWDVDRRLPPLPPRDDGPRMARFVTHVSDWGSLATVSTIEEVRGRPFADILSISDGPPGEGTGEPYMYLSPLQQAVSDLQVSGSAALFPKPGRAGNQPLQFSPPRRAWVLEIRILKPAHVTVSSGQRWLGGGCSIPDIGQLPGSFYSYPVTGLSAWGKFFASTWSTSHPSNSQASS